MRLTPAVASTLSWLVEIGLLKLPELRHVQVLFEPCFEFAEAVRLAESIHLHLKVEDTERLPMAEFARRGGVLANGRPGYGKHCFPDGLNLIYSTIPIAQDDLAETPEQMRPRPFLDHIGIDLREESEAVRAGFASLQQRADELGWGHIPQGGKGRPVFCCHIEVAAKRWVYPPGGPKGSGIPLEFAFGPLRVSDLKAGCDLRPSSPLVPAAVTPAVPCCA